MKVLTNDEHCSFAWKNDISVCVLYFLISHSVPIFKENLTQIHCYPFPPLTAITQADWRPHQLVKIPLFLFSEPLRPTKLRKALYTDVFCVCQYPAVIMICSLPGSVIPCWFILLVATMWILCVSPLPNRPPPLCAHPSSPPPLCL